LAALTAQSDHDSALDMDSVRSFETRSLSESIRQYRVENGRRYHARREGS
jgi:hypothetical protein